jgi:3-oxoacyl-[acyl-carrier-protein] synthase-3
MSTMILQPPRIKAVATCVPPNKVDTLKDVTGFSADEIERFVKMVGVKTRYLADETICCSDLCAAAAENILEELQWDRQSVDALIMITHTPDYILPATAGTIQHRLNLPDTCACFDVGLGCSGYCYGLWLASMMLEKGQFKRVLLLVGETPARMSHDKDRSVALLFGDAGSATALEASKENDKQDPWYFALHSDGSRYVDFVVEAGGLRKRFSDDELDYYIRMDGANIFNFSIKRVPPLVGETMSLSGIDDQDIDYYILHQANKFIIDHLLKKLKLDPAKAPITIDAFGNVGGCSIPLTITMGGMQRPNNQSLKLMVLGYGVGLSWASALIDLEPGAILRHEILQT